MVTDDTDEEQRGPVLVGSNASKDSSGIYGVGDDGRVDHAFYPPATGGMNATSALAGSGSSGSAYERFTAIAGASGS